MSQAVRLSRVGRSVIVAVLLLACIVAATGGASLGAAEPALYVPAGETVRIGDVVPDEVIRSTWDNLSPAMRESLRQRKGVATIDDLRDLRITGPHTIPYYRTEPLGRDPDAVQEVEPIAPHEMPANVVTQHVVVGDVETADGELPRIIREGRHR